MDVSMLVRFGLVVLVLVALLTATDGTWGSPGRRRGHTRLRRQAVRYGAAVDHSTLHVGYHGGSDSEGGGLDGGSGGSC